MQSQEFCESHSAGQILKGLAASFDRLGKAGYDAKPGSRFRLFLEEFRRFSQAAEGSWPVDGLDASLLSQGLVDCYELDLISRCQAVLAENRIEVMEMLSGSALPAEDSLTKPRDLQFQLFVAANLDLMGLKIHLKEPDVRIDYADTTLGVAAKRIRSLAKLEERLKEATRQIQGQQLNGFIALGLELIAAGNKIVVAAGQAALADAGDTLGNRALDALKPVAKKTYSPSTIGYLVWVVIPVVFPKQRSVAFSSFYRGLYDPRSIMAKEICRMVPPHSAWT